MAEQHTSIAGAEQQASRLLAVAPQRAILVGVEMPGTDWPLEESLDELEQLARTAGVTTADRVTQRLARPHPGTLLGSGKVEELAELVRKHDYRFREEPRGNEMTAWRRAAQLFVGNKGIR